MANAISMQVVQSIESLSHNECTLGLSQMLALRDKEEELATLTQSKSIVLSLDKSHGYSNKWTYSVTRKQMRSVSHVS